MPHSIPFFSLKRQWDKLEPQVNKAIKKVLDSQQYVGGEFVATFEDKLSKYLGAKAVSCNSGTDALWLALKALNLGKNDIVLTTPFSFIASSSEVIAHGGHPVFIDVDEKTFNISPQRLEDWLKNNAHIKNGATFHKITDYKVAGIIAVNIFGQCADYDKIRAIANQWNLWIVEDAAQSIGSRIDAKKSGTLGDIACFSFYPTKNLGAFGDAGAMSTNNPALAERLTILRNHGRKSGYDYQEYGLNSRLDGIQAAVLNEKIDSVDAWNARRRSIATHYNNALGSIKSVQIPLTAVGEHTFHQYSLVISDNMKKNLRDQLKDYLTQNQIGTNVFYPKAFTQIPYLQTDPRLKTECPVAESLTKTIIALPIWPELEEKELEFICNKIKEFFEEDTKFTQAPQSRKPYEPTN